MTNDCGPVLSMPMGPAFSVMLLLSYPLYSCHTSCRSCHTSCCPSCHTSCRTSCHTSIHSSYPTCYPAISFSRPGQTGIPFHQPHSSHSHLPVCSQVIERTIFPVPSGPHVSVTVKRVPYAVNLLPASNHTGSVLADIVPVCPILMPARSTGSFSCPGSCPDHCLFLCLSLRLAGAWAWVWAGA